MNVSLKRRRSVLVVVALAAAVSFAVAGCRNAGDPSAGAPGSDSAGPVTQGSEAIDFTLASLSGETVRLSEFRGISNVLLHFGTTWCPPCRTQAPKLNALHDFYPPEELVILSVDSGEPADIVRRVAEEEGSRYKTLLDTDGGVATAYGVEFIPLNVLVDKDGIVHAKPSNAIPENAIRELVGR